MSRLSDAADVLYAADPEDFIDRRKALAVEARAAGDKAVAKDIAALGKPTRSAWLVNRLVRDDPTVPAQLAELGGQLRSGESSLDGESIRKLSVARRKLVDSLVRAAVDQAGEAVSAAVRDEVADTFNAALADPDIAGQVGAGVVVRAIRWAGFGPGVGTGTALDPAAAFQLGPAPAQPKPSAPRPASPRPAPANPAQAKPTQAKPAQAKPAPAKPTPAKQQRAAAEQALAEAITTAQAAAAVERDQQEAVRLVVEQHSADRERLADAERALADAHQRLAQAQRAVGQAEHDQADAEQRLAKSRQSLSRERNRAKDAGSSARQAAAAQKRAQQALDRLPAQAP